MSNSPFFYFGIKINKKIYIHLLISFVKSWEKHIEKSWERHLKRENAFAFASVSASEIFFFMLVIYIWTIHVKDFLLY